MKSISKTYNINSSIDAVWNCLTNAAEMESWGAAPAHFIAKTGAAFNMWGDYLEGTVTNLVKPTLLEQDWIVDGMHEASKVTFELSESDGQTQLILKHKNIPDPLADELDEGWGDYYLGAIKDYLEK